VLDKGAIPCESKDEGRNKNVEDEEEKLREHIRFVLRLGDFLDHFY